MLQSERRSGLDNQQQQSQQQRWQSQQAARKQARLAPDVAAALMANNRRFGDKTQAHRADRQRESGAVGTDAAEVAMSRESNLFDEW